MATIFTKIIQGEIPGTFVWRDDLCVGFMSINPLRHGHILVVPIREIDHWIDCPDHLRDHLFEVAQRLATAQQAAFRPSRVGLMIAGLEVPHLHLHLVPIDAAHDLDFANAARSVDPADLERAAEAIRSELRAAGEPGAT